MNVTGGGEAISVPQTGVEESRLLAPRGPSALGWRARGEHVALGLRVATVLTRRMPTFLRYRLADIGGEGAFYLLSRQARQARQNYSLFTAPGDRAGAARLARRAFRNYAGTVMDFLILDRLLEELRRSGGIDLTVLEQVLESGKGAIVVTPHFGNWDLGAAATGSGGREVFAVADPFGPPAVDQMVRRSRERIGVHIIPTGVTSVRAALRVLQRNQVLCLACDIDKGGAGVAVSFLGTRVLLPGGPGTLAIRTGARLIPGYVRRLPGGRHQARLLEPLPMPTSGTPQEQVAQLTQAIASTFETIIRSDPGQWFAFHSLSRAQLPPAAS